MTAPRRWPKRAEAARVESLAAAREIGQLGAKAKGLLLQRKIDLAMVLVGEMQLAAKEIEMQLLLAKGEGA